MTLRLCVVVRASIGGDGYNYRRSMAADACPSDSVALPGTVFREPPNNSGSTNVFLTAFYSKSYVLCQTSVLPCDYSYYYYTGFRLSAAG